MNPEELLTELSVRGVIIKAVDNKLRIDAPKGALTSELRQAIAEQKLAILTLMQRNATQPVAVAPIQESELNAPQRRLHVELKDTRGKRPSKLTCPACQADRRVASAPAVQELDPQEKELDELISQLRKVNRHWKIEWARKKNVPIKALLHAATFWLSDDPSDWTAANDTIFAFTSQWGHKQLCSPRVEKVAIPDIASK